MKQFIVLSLCAAVFSLFTNQASFARGKGTILAVAKSQVGVREYRGRGTNPRIAKYFRRAVGRTYSDSMPWCAAFIGYVVKQSGHRGTNSLSARSYLRWGRRTSNPRPGDLVVFRRRSGGHVGVFVGFSGNRVKVIGGNQSNRVSYKSYPRYRVLGYRTSGRGSSRPVKSRYVKRKTRRNKKYRLASKRRNRGSRRASNRRQASRRRRVAALKKRKRRNRRRRATQAPVYSAPAPVAPRSHFGIDGSSTL